MNNRSKSVTFVAIAFALTIPFVAFAAFFFLRFQQNYWPVWFANTLGIWFVVNFLIMLLVAKKVFRKQNISEKKFVPSSKTGTRLWIIRGVIGYLVFVWSVIFAKGVIGTVRGEYEPARAIPAGIFLLFFILLFGWTLYRSFQPNNS
jgi:small-conductance mechanosensitive channel